MDYKFKINDFEGPLDLLLHLIKESKMDILDIKIVDLTEQYLNYINSMELLNLTIASEYLIMASNLIQLKSKSLLPHASDEEENDEYEEERKDLVDRLLEYQKYKDMTKTLKDYEEKRKELYTKIPSNLQEYRNKDVYLSEDITLNDLMIALKKVIERSKALGPINTKVTSKEISVEERTSNIREILKERKRVEFSELFDNYSKSYIIVTFLAILELAKKCEMKIVQENNFDKIYCEVA